MLVETFENSLILMEYEPKDFNQLIFLIHSISSEVYPIYMSEDKTETKILLVNLDGFLNSDKMKTFDVELFKNYSLKEIIEKVKR